MRKQSGLTLFVAMIILVMITLLVVSAFKVSNTNLKIVGAMQGRQEAVADRARARGALRRHRAASAHPPRLSPRPRPGSQSG